MRGAFGQDPEFARKMAVKRWKSYRLRKSWEKRKLDSPIIRELS